MTNVFEKKPFTQKIARHLLPAFERRYGPLKISFHRIDSLSGLLVKKYCDDLEVTLPEDALCLSLDGLSFHPHVEYGTLKRLQKFKQEFKHFELLFRDLLTGTLMKNIDLIYGITPNHSLANLAHKKFGFKILKAYSIQESEHGQSKEIARYFICIPKEQFPGLKNKLEQLKKTIADHRED